MSYQMDSAQHAEIAGSQLSNKSFSETTQFHIDVRTATVLDKYPGSDTDAGEHMSHY